MCCYRGPTYRGGKSTCKLVTEFGGYSYDGVSAVIGVQHTGPKSGCKPLTLFGGYSYDGVCAVIGVQHTEVANLGASLADSTIFEICFEICLLAVQ